MKRLLPALLLWLPIAAAAQTTPPAPQPPSSQQLAAEQNAAEQAAMQASTRGPADIRLLDQGSIHIPPGDAWVPKDATNRLLRAWGNSDDDNVLGMVEASNGDRNASAIISYNNAGHVKDDDARNLDAASLLDSLRSATEADNADRIARGFKPYTLGVWLQPPQYDAALKHLVWAFPVQDQGEPAANATVNYNTRALGRDGYLSLNLLTKPADFAADKPVADGLLAGLTYLPGKRYQDFISGSDRVAAYGLAGLLGVIALKKLGLIALATVFVLKFAKLGIIAVVGAGVAVKKFWRRKPPSQTSA